MAYRTPGALDGDNEVDPERARTEVLARAFADAAGGYFERWKEYEDAISEAEARMEQMQKVGFAAVIIGLLSVFVGLVLVGGDAGLLLSGIGILLAVAGGLYAYKEYTQAQERIEEHEQRIAENEPDGEVTFVSQVGVPLYLVPYGDRHMVFDGLDVAPTTTLDLANIDVGALATLRDGLDDRKALYDEYLAGETVLSPAVADQLPAAFARQLSREGDGTPVLEEPLVHQIAEMTSVAADIERETIEANVHANNQKSRSVSGLAGHDLLRQDGDLQLVETRQSMAESEAVVDEIRGFEELAVSGDMLDQARGHRDRVDSIATEIADRLQTNVDTVRDHYDAYGDDVETATRKFVCPECLEERVADIDDELDLVDQILDSQQGSLGAALSDEDLNRGVDENWTDNIRADIEEPIPELDETLKRAFNTLEDLGPAGGYCDVHGQVEAQPVRCDGAVFGEVWRSLYYAFREPIMDSVEDLEREAEEVRQNKEQKMIDLTQYEQIKDSVEREYRSVESEYEAAQIVENQLGGR